MQHNISKHASHHQAQTTVQFTGKDEYQFGDVSKKLLSNMFGKRKTGGGS
jgi:hypothetical protein